MEWGGVVGRKFLYEMKRMEMDEDSPLERPWIDLNELANWGNKGIIYGERSHRFLDTVPFKVGKGGRIKKFAEDKMVDVGTYGDERNFLDVRFSSQSEWLNRRKLHYRLHDRRYTSSRICTYDVGGHADC